jgi:quinol-cytochrome oxidoreductase complex cytochrome b subunit
VTRAPAPGRPLRRARSAVLAALAGELLLLVATGVWLTFHYRPSGRQAWIDRSGGARHVWDWVRLAHNALSWLTIATAVAVLLLAVLATARRPRWIGPALGGGLVVTSVAAAATGYLLPWDQLALWAVTVGSDFDGFFGLRDDRVRFVLIGHREVAASVVLGRLELHALVLTPALAVLAVLPWRRGRTGRTGTGAAAFPAPAIGPVDSRP